MNISQHIILKENSFFKCHANHIFLAYFSVHCWQVICGLHKLTHQCIRNCSSWAKSSLPPVFVNKVLLAHGHIHSFTLFSVAAFALKGRVEQLWQSLKYFLCCSWKKFAHLCYRHILSTNFDYLTLFWYGIEPISYNLGHSLQGFLADQTNIFTSHNLTWLS